MARNRHRNRNRKKDKEMAMPPMVPGQEPMGMASAGTGAMPGKPPMNPGMAASAPPIEGEGSEDGESNVTPEEQELFDTILARYFNGMYVKGKVASPDGEPPLLEQVHAFFKDAQNEENPISFVDVLGNVTAKTVMVLEDKMEGEGVDVPDDILMHAGMRILSDLAEFSSSAGYHDYTEKELAGASTQAFSIYGEERKVQGKLDMDQIKGEFDTLMAADKAGTLDDVLPGSSQAAEELKPPEGEGEAQQPQTGIASANPQQLPPRRV